MLTRLVLQTFLHKNAILLDSHRLDMGRLALPRQQLENILCIIGGSEKSQWKEGGDEKVAWSKIGLPIGEERGEQGFRSVAECYAGREEEEQSRLPPRHGAMTEEVLTGEVKGEQEEEEGKEETLDLSDILDG